MFKNTTHVLVRNILWNTTDTIRKNTWFNPVVVYKDDNKTTIILKSVFNKYHLFYIPYELNTEIINIGLYTVREHKNKQYSSKEYRYNNMISKAMEDLYVKIINDFHDSNNWYVVKSYYDEKLIITVSLVKDRQINMSDKQQLIKGFKTSEDKIYIVDVNHTY